MTILQCKYVVEIARTGSFSEAAKQLFVAQSSLSVSIKSLEQELNIQIFERSGNGVYLTDEGAEFIKYAKQICENNDFVMERYNSKQIQQKLYIATQHYDFIADIFGKMINESEMQSYRLSIRETEELMDVSYIDKHIEISDRATLMNLLMITDAYTVGTGIMPSALNKGDIVSVPLQSEEIYIIGYILNEERSVSKITQGFIDRMKNALNVI